MRPLRDGKIDSDPPPVNLHSRTTLPGLFRVIKVLEIHESKSAAPSGGAVIDDVRAGQRSVTSEDLLEILFSRIVGEIEDAETGAFGRSVAISLVTLSVGHGRAGPPATAIGRPTSVSAVSPTAIPTIARTGSRTSASAVARPRARAATTPVAAAAAAFSIATATLLSALAPRRRAAASAPARALARAFAFTLALAARGALVARGGSRFSRSPLSGRVRVVGTSRTRAWTRHPGSGFL